MNSFYVIVHSYVQCTCEVNQHVVRMSAGEEVSLSKSRSDFLFSNNSVLRPVERV